MEQTKPIQLSHNKSVQIAELLYRLVYMVAIVIIGIISQLGFRLAAPIALIFSSVFLVYRLKNNRFFLFFSMVIFLFNFSIAMNEYIDLEKQILFTGLSDNQFVMHTSLNVMNIFMVALNLCIETPKEKKQLPFVENNLIFFSLCGVLFILCAMKIFLRWDMINKVFEYCNILFLFLCFTSNNKKNKKYIIIGLLVVYIMSLSLSVFVKKEATGRIDFIQSFFVVFLYFYIDKLKFMHLASIAIMIVIIMCVMVSMRGGVVSGLSLTRLVKEAYETIFLNDTAHFAYASSTTIVAYKEYNAPTNMNIINFWQFVLAQFIGTGTSLTNQSVLSLITREYYVHYYGTCFPFYFYFWLGYLGVFLGGVCVALIINKLYKKKSPLTSLMFIMIFSTIFRWYLYSPNAFFRGCIILPTIAYGVVKIFNYKAKCHYE